MSNLHVFPHSKFWGRYLLFVAKENKNELFFNDFTFFRKRNIKVYKVDHGMKSPTNVFVSAS